MEIREPDFSLYNECRSIGLVVESVNASGAVSFTEPDVGNLLPFIIAAHGKGLNKAPCIALKTALGGDADPRWLAYVAARKAPTKDKRENRFRKETDNIFLQAFELANGAVDVTINGVIFRLPTASSLDLWEAAKAQIRNDLPYD